VLQAANRFIETQKPKTIPPWHQALTNIPPAEILVRPVQRFTDARRKAKGKKPSKMFQPLPLTYPEDDLRHTFFNDHPWELARPKVVLENTGDDAKAWDWTQGLEQKGKAVDGER
jgi:small subunit ribosomal protein S23